MRSRRRAGGAHPVTVNRSPTLRVNNPWADRSWLASFNPTTPQAAAGTRIEPPASVPWAARTVSSATTTAAPADEPPGVQPGKAGDSSTGTPGRSA